MAIEAKNVLTFEKRPLVAELKLEMSQIAQFIVFNFRFAITGRFSNVYSDIFSICDHLVKKAATLKESVDLYVAL